MMGELSNQAAVQRTKDIEDVLSMDMCSFIEVVDQQTANWSRDEAQDLMANWLSSGEPFDALIANNDEMAIGAIQAMKAAGHRYGFRRGGAELTRPQTLSPQWPQVISTSLCSRRCRSGRRRSGCRTETGCWRRCRPESLRAVRASDAPPTSVTTRSNQTPRLDVKTVKRSASAASPYAPVTACRNLGARYVENIARRRGIDLRR